MSKKFFSEKNTAEPRLVVKARFRNDADYEAAVAKHQIVETTDNDGIEYATVRSIATGSRESATKTKPITGTAKITKKEFETIENVLNSRRCSNSSMMRMVHFARLLDPHMAPVVAAILGLIRLTPCAYVYMCIHICACL